MKNADRWRCCITGCNPKLPGEQHAIKHKLETGHRIARWPVRSPEGKRKARERNRNGYYDKYSVGEKPRSARILGGHMKGHLGGGGHDALLSGDDWSEEGLQGNF